VAVRSYLCEDTSITSEDTEHDCFTESTTASFSFDAASVEVAFVNFNFSRKRRSAPKESGNSFSDSCEMPVDGIPVESGILSNLRSVQID
jgi:uncharacterized iron-regulated protein